MNEDCNTACGVPFRDYPQREQVKKLNEQLNKERIQLLKNARKCKNKDIKKFLLNQACHVENISAEVRSMSIKRHKIQMLMIHKYGEGLRSGYQEAERAMENGLTHPNEFGYWC